MLKSVSNPTIKLIIIITVIIHGKYTGRARNQGNIKTTILGTANTL